MAKKRRRRKFSWYLSWSLFFSFAAILLFLLISLLPIWQIEEIKVSGNRFVPREEILKEADSLIGKNIFWADLAGVRENLLKIEIIKEAKVKRALPNAIAIEVKERVEAAVAVISGRTVFFDNEGYLLGMRDSNIQITDLAVISGLKAEDILSGKIKDGVREEIAELMSALSESFPKEKIKIDLSSLPEVMILLDDVMLVKIGEISGLKKKLEVVRDLRDFEQNRAAQIEYIDVRVPDSPVIRFKK
ncbi:hypothetical protein A2276_02600 [candidate division WOR-1 bacterium RIFOXYA12_FULL_43_27]|uniref:POTRA domain-containing protein n=1 Tax=candidate division WOR-1 bacterium RIFOXYC2_FULL_46_14 TaxID=1802587 RepID=A0A1F4U7W4_UNCSA|nr:MAG: hypothetical protein A2276_02600 [candidate division WOR-1 bacterium RIFOXYA12_FULL_43_27]OGC19398.1 MAG: hypothetical protein A2292_01730 [candidate division WOR-1 bacterium RIFOXYB2_FULL_46_45]OGC30387.1 MAG: hypothetical protein A2232_01730 [candidate division WOR-1 bacterium RIFOXYA2_FULL_46_56]OGC40987.1 MAG: hypothetical protein A2438_01730 [candidate division WOR-1 bacterium RIFOXYC2_FULL_46_14]